jgi:hypothetical protein
MACDGPLQSCTGDVCSADASGFREMGLGLLGDPSIVFKRKFRWTLIICFCSGSKFVPESFVKMGARPNLDIEETQIDFLHGRFWLPGKVTFNEMQVTYYDVAGTVAGQPSTASIFDWIATVYDITDPTCLKMGNRADYEGTGIMRLYDGCGQTIEAWTIEGMWPKSVDFGELDMTSSDECTIQLTLRYRNLQYNSCCPTSAITRCECTPCA